MIMAKQIRILSMNCQGLGDLDKCRDIFQFLREKKYDIYFLQDTHFTKKVENHIRSMWGLECVFDSYNSQSRGVTILFNNTMDYKIQQVIKGNDGNKLVLDISLNDRKLTLVNIYGPNRDSPNFYNELKNDIISCGNETVVMGGDFNLVLDFQKDCYITM